MSLCRRTITALLAFILASASSYALDAQLIELAEQTEISPESINQIQELRKTGGQNEAIAVLLLYRTDPEKYESAFRDYYHIDKTQPTTTLSADQINDEVNAIIKANRDKHPLEITANIYFKYRGSNQVALSSNGEPMYLEMIFRAGLFTGVLKPSDEELLRLSALADS